VGFKGYPHDYIHSSSFSQNETQSSSLGLILDTQLDVQAPTLLRGIDWIYSWLESSAAYLTTILYESELNTTDISSFEHIIWSHDYKLSVYILLGTIYDIKILSNSTLFPYVDNWYNYINTAANNIVFHLEHPEHHFFFSGALIDFVLPYIAKINFLIQLESPNEGIILIPLILLEIIFKISLVGIFVSFLMNWYSISVNSNNVDSDFLVNSLSIESEEEIASIDDTVLLLIVIFFIFGWFFFFNYLTILTFLGEVIYIFIFLPFLLYIMFFIPIFLLFDYGMYFITYLRGAGSSASLLMEFIYDCIAFLAFFIRLSVQNVRLLLITLTFFSLYEFILFFVNVNWFNSNFEQIDNIASNSQGIQHSYYYFNYVINKFLYWMYELLHTFFVTVAQFVAFFAMVFWLFLFLYTMFVVEEFEKYLDDKRRKINK
jgi:hypothetical protein